MSRKFNSPSTNAPPPVDFKTCVDRHDLELVSSEILRLDFRDIDGAFSLETRLEM